MSDPQTPENDQPELSLEDLAATHTLEAPRQTVRDTLESAVDDAAKQRTQAAQPAQSQPTDAQPVEAPKHWSKEDRDTFAKQPPEAQAWLLARHKAMEGDNTRVHQELSDLKKWREPLDQVMAPYADLMRQHNLTPAHVLQNYIGVEQALVRDPIGSLLQLAQRFNVKPEDLLSRIYSGNGQGAPQQQEAVDPALKALQDEIAGLKGYLGQQAQAAQRQEATTMQSQINTFATSTDQSGAKLYPHIENQQVRDMMSVLIASGRVDIAKAGGVVLALKEAYEQAVYANPETRSALLQSAIEAQTKKAAQTQAEKVAKARSAGASVTGTSALSATPAAKGSLRAQLEAAARETGFLN